MMSRQDRECILEGMKALNRLCLKIEKESVGCEKIAFHGRGFTVTWMLGFDGELKAFEASVSVIPADRSSDSRNGNVCVDLENYIQDRLDGLRDHEAWPTAIPPSWLEDAAKLFHFEDDIPTPTIEPPHRL